MEILKGPQKKVYTAPTLILYGSVEVITQEVGCGSTLDKDFQAGDSFSSVTCFS